MRILAIRGKNLASLEGEFDIDFTTEPLKSAGIFAITGSTGSGKSTLLDALCLALFDDMPRTNRATENISVADVKDKTIQQKDSRNILRRGTSEGYAEVDFISLGGEVFRSTWSVRRARGKADGSLQATEFRLFNISANHEEQGRKTELLARIRELIGLTFDQFTRAVLLAQGDFATFLKARQSEKAELLEKLTGTDIYSRISASIYEHFKKSEQELHLLKERIQGIELLPDDQYAALSAEISLLSAEIKQEESEIARLSASLKWMTDEESLREGLQQAEQQQVDCQRLLDAARPRSDYLSRLDSVQDIRDCFQQIKTIRKQLNEHRAQLQTREAEQKDASLLRQQAEKKAISAEATKKHLQDKISDLKPQLHQARDLDISITQAQAKKNEIHTNYSSTLAAKENAKKNLEEYRVELTKAQSAHETCRDWLDRHKTYETLIDRIELISTLANDAIAAHNQKKLNEETLKNSEALLQSATALLQKQELEAERLNRLLPSEIAALRLQLKEGTPCPVCGSEHHPLHGVQGETLEEKEINREKENLQKTTAKLLTTIEERRAEIIRLQSLVKNYASQIGEAESRLQEYLKDFPEWQTLLRKGALIGQLRQLSQDWIMRTTGLSKAAADIQQWEQAQQLGEERLKDTTTQWQRMEQAFHDCVSHGEILQKARSKLFSGRPADEVENDYSIRLQQQEELLTEYLMEKQAMESKCAGIAGTIAQLQQAIKEASDREHTWQNELDAWLNTRADKLSRDELAELLTHNSQWVEKERMELESLRQNKISAVAAVNERLRILQAHARSADRASEGDTRELLQAKREGQAETLEKKKERKTELEIRLVNHAKGKEKIKSFENELNEKTQISENWKKINELYGSADGSKFKILAQGYTLDALLSYANRHLQELTARISPSIS